MSAKGLELTLQIPKQRNALIGGFRDAPIYKERGNSGAVFKRPLIFNPISSTTEIHGHRKSQFWKVHCNASGSRLYFKSIY